MLGALQASSSPVNNIIKQRRDSIEGTIPKFNDAFADLSAFFDSCNVGNLDSPGVDFKSRCSYINKRAVIAFGAKKISKEDLVAIEILTMAGGVIITDNERRALLNLNKPQASSKAKLYLAVVVLTGIISILALQYFKK